MTREARRRGGDPYDDRDYYHGHGSRGNCDQGRWERNASSGHYRDHRPPSDWRGPPPDWRGPSDRYEYDYRPRGSRSPHRGPRRGRDQSLSESRSLSRSSSVSQSGSRSRSRTRKDHEMEGSRSRSRETPNGAVEEKAARSSSKSASGSDRRRQERHDESGGSGRNSGSRRRHRGSYRYTRPDHYRHQRRTYFSDSYSDSSSSEESSSSSSESEGEKNELQGDDPAFSKDQRTVFVSQLVMRATEKDIRRYFQRKVGCKVKDVILLRDKRTSNHKGCAYVQMGRIEDVNKAVGVAGQPPDFQRFPLLVKASEAEKNYVIPASSSVVTASMMGTTASLAPLLNEQGHIIESQKVYVGGLDPSISEEHLFAIFSQFGQLEKVSMQMDPATQMSKGYAFLSFRDPKEANLAVQTISNQMLLGKPLKTGWANQASSVLGVEVVTSDEFPPDASGRAQKAFSVLSQLMGSVPSAGDSVDLPATAEKAVDAAMGISQDASSQSSSLKGGTTASGSTTGPMVHTDPKAILKHTDPKVIMEQAAKNVDAAIVAAAELALKGSATEMAKQVGNASDPTRFILVHNMFDKEEEEGDGWEVEIQEDFMEEASKFGKVNKVIAMSQEIGGKLYASFETTEAAENCATNLAGRWFDKRQLRVDFVQESDFPKHKEG